MSGNGANVTKFGIIDGVSPAIAEFVALEIQNATKEFIAQGGPAVVGGVPQYSNTQGKLVTSTPYSLPNTVGVVGQVLEVDVGGNIVYGTGGGAPPTYLSTLTVTNLSQGPSDLIQNYTFPNYAPLADQVITSSGSYVLDMIGSLPITFQLATINNGTQNFNIQFGFRDTVVEDILDGLNVVVRGVLSQFNCIAEITFRYNSLTNRFGFDLLPNPAPSNFLFLRWDGYIAGVNSNNLFGITTTIAVQIGLPSATAPDPSAATLSNICVWRSLSNIPVSNIQSTTGTSSIQCEDVGVGQSGIISYGDYNINNGSINNCGNINALDNCNITTNTTQIVNGLSELNININSLPRITQNAIKTKLECGVSSLQLAAVSDGLSADTVTYIAASNIGNTQNTISLYLPDEYLLIQNNAAIQRIVVDNAGTKLYSKSVQTGPTGSYLNLNDDSSFSLGSYFAGNGAVECTTNSLALVGPQAKSAVVLTDATITKSLFNGTFTAVRETMDSMGQTFKDGNQVERIKLDNTDVTINGAYTLPTTAGTTGQVLTRDTGISSTWQTPQLYGLYSQTGTATVANTIVETTLIGSGVGSLSVPANYFTTGMSFRYNTGGTFRDNANNTTFRFRLRNGGVLFDSGILTLPLITVVSAWNIDVTFSYIGGTTIITNFNFQYNNGSDARGFTSQNTNNTLNTAIPNTLNFTVQWGAASANNTITTNFGVLQKIY